MVQGRNGSVSEEEPQSSVRPENLVSMPDSTILPVSSADSSTEPPPTILKPLLARQAGDNIHPFLGTGPPLVQREAPTNSNKQLSVDILASYRNARQRCLFLE
jgi:hypothetical protein